MMQISDNRTHDMGDGKVAPVRRWRSYAPSGQGEGHVGRKISAVGSRPQIDKDVNFAKKIPSFIKINMESINLMENPSDFVESYFTRKTLNF